VKLIIQSGITEVVYYSDKYGLDWQYQTARKMLDETNIQYWQHVPKQKKLVIDFSVIDEKINK
jgi:dCMP deaminase